MNWIILIPFGIAAIALVVFLIKRNLKDENEFEKDANNDIAKQTAEEGDIETEDMIK